MHPRYELVSSKCLAAAVYFPKEDGLSVESMLAGDSQQENVIHRVGLEINKVTTKF